MLRFQKADFYEYERRSQNCRSRQHRRCASLFFFWNCVSNLAANIGNSIYVVLETLVIIVICVVPCSYCLVRYKFPGAKLILNIYMAAIFIQATYIMIPLFLQMNKLNLLNSLTALGVLYL